MKELFASPKPNTLMNSTVQLVLVHLNTASSCNDFDILQLILTLIVEASSQLIVSLLLGHSLHCF